MISQGRGLELTFGGCQHLPTILNDFYDCVSSNYFISCLEHLGTVNMVASRWHGGQLPSAIHCCFFRWTTGLVSIDKHRYNMSTWVKICQNWGYHCTNQPTEFYLCLFCSIIPIHFWWISSIMFDRYPCGWCISSWWCCSCHTRLHHRGGMRCVVGMAGDGFWAMTMDWRIT